MIQDNKYYNKFYAFIVDDTRILENILMVSYLGFSSNIFVISYAIILIFASETLFIFLFKAFLISIAYSEFKLT